MSHGNGIVIRLSAMALLSMVKEGGNCQKTALPRKTCHTYLLSGLVITRCTGSTTDGVSWCQKGDPIG